MNYDWSLAGYGIYVWPAYLSAFSLIGLLVWRAVARLKSAKYALRQVEVTHVK